MRKNYSFTVLTDLSFEIGLRQKESMLTEKLFFLWNTWKLLLCSFLISTCLHFLLSFYENCCFLKENNNFPTFGEENSQNTYLYLARLQLLYLDLCWGKLGSHSSWLIDPFFFKLLCIFFTRGYTDVYPPLYVSCTNVVPYVTPIC